MRTFFHSAFEKVKQLDNYSLAILFSLPTAMALLIAFLALGGWSAIWYFNLFLPAAFIASFLSGATYVGRIIDGITIRSPAETLNSQDEKTDSIIKTVVSTLLNSIVPVNRQIKLSEKLGTIIGVVTGLAIMSAFIGLSAPIPMLGIFSYFAHGLFGLSLVGLFAGLGARLGSLGGNRSKAEKITLSVAAGIGLLLAVGFVVLMLLFPTIAVPGIWLTSLLVSSTHLPMWLSIGVFVVGFTSMVTSCADYFCKAGCFLKYLITHQQDAKSETNQTVEKKLHEYRGAFVGIILGIALSAAVIIPLVMMPPVPIAIGGLIALGMIAFMAITSGLGGIVSRIGRLIDNGSNNKEEIVEIQSTADKKITTANSLVKDSANKILQYLQAQSERNVSSTNKDKNAEEEQQLVYPAVLQPFRNAKLPANEFEANSNIAQTPFTATPVIAV